MLHAESSGISQLKLQVVIFTFIIVVTKSGIPSVELKISGRGGMCHQHVVDNLNIYI